MGECGQRADGCAAIVYVCRASGARALADGFPARHADCVDDRCGVVVLQQHVDAARVGVAAEGRRVDSDAEGCAESQRRAQREKRKTDWTMWIELGLAIYAIVALVIIVQFGLWAAVLPLLLYVAGFGGLWLSQVVETLDI